MLQLSAIRSLARPRFRAFRRTLLSTLGMAAIVVGLLAMHSSGADHPSAAELPVAAAEPAHTGHVASPVAVAAAVTTTLTSAAANALLCDEACMHGVLDCAVMFMSCAMLVAVAALIVFAHRPGILRKLLDAGARVVALPATAPLHVHRPDLTVLSISRT